MKNFSYLRLTLLVLLIASFAVSDVAADNQRRFLVEPVGWLRPMKHPYSLISSSVDRCLAFCREQLEECKNDCPPKSDDPENHEWFQCRHACHNDASKCGQACP